MEKLDPDRLDSILDGALSRYASAEPLAGIEQRVLNRIGAAGPGHRTSKILAWALCCPVLIALVPMAISVWTAAVMKPAHIDFASVPHIAPPANAFVRVRQPVRKCPFRIALPSTSLSSEERGLLALVQSHPAEAQEFLAWMQRPVEDPVDIDEIEVTPLQIPEVH
ncbi:MAG: hypothetical protein M3Z32_06590 [Acidobacteriota bacterium]|nr:hypothetical protein [Acidobacteriota bacterium]